MFVDTPGVHKPTNLLDKRMLQEVYDALESRNVVLHVVDVTRRLRLPEVKEKVTEIDLDALLLGEQQPIPPLRPRKKTSVGMTICSATARRGAAPVAAAFAGE